MKAEKVFTNFLDFKSYFFVFFSKFLDFYDILKCGKMVRFFVTIFKATDTLYFFLILTFVFHFFGLKNFNFLFFFRIRDRHLPGDFASPAFSRSGPNTPARSPECAALLAQSGADHCFLLFMRMFVSFSRFYFFICDQISALNFL